MLYEMDFVQQMLSDKHFMKKLSTKLTGFTMTTIYNMERAIASAHL
jgi:hypothetical protein